MSDASDALGRWQINADREMQLREAGYRALRHGAKVKRSPIMRRRDGHAD